MSTLLRAGTRAAAVVSFTLAVASFAQSPQPVPAPYPHPAFPGVETSLGRQIAALIAADASASRAHWGVAVTALDGTPIYGLNEGQYFRPASNTKIYTSIAATSLLGLDSTVTTYVDAEAPLEKGTIHGNVSLHGAGDGNLSARPIPYQTPAEAKANTAPLPDPLRYIDELAAGVAAAGVKKITGDILGDDSLWRWEPYPGSWSIDDMVGYDGSPVSALTIDDNAVDVVITPGKAPGQPATITFKPEVGFYSIENKVTTVAAPPPDSHGGANGPRLRLDREVGSRALEVYGSVAVGQPVTRSIAISDPAEFAALALKQKLEQHGVKVEGTARARHREDTSTNGYMAEVMAPASLGPAAPVPEPNRGPKLLYVEHKSGPLSEDLTVTLKVSQNLHAELFLRRLAEGSGDIGYAAMGAHVERQFLTKQAGLDPDDFVFYDGSGLSSHDMVTPRTTAQLLKYATTQPWFATWKAALPVGGVDGTVSTRFSEDPLKGHIFAKTGTLGESRALSGYLDCASGRQVIFSVMADTHSPVTAADRVVMDKIVAAIAAAN